MKKLSVVCLAISGLNIGVIAICLFCRSQHFAPPPPEIFFPSWLISAAITGGLAWLLA